LAIVIDARAGVIEIGREDFDALRAAIRASVAHSVLDRMASDLRCEPVGVALGRCGAQARELAKRLEKGDLDVVIDARDIRLDPERWKPVWSAFDHAIRNAVDHGIEDETERRMQGKNPSGQLRLSADLENEQLIIALSDDGRGVDWERVRDLARARRLPHHSRADLVNALFTDGLTTRDTATSVSGRGIGLNALKAAVDELDGRIEIESMPGMGTTIRMRFPADARSSLRPSVDAAAA
jgi:two-component system chemotaxis sensor kinase CheA